LMLLQSVGERVYVLPAWPRNWNVSFKLHAPKQTTVECEVKGGKMVKLKVTPESRRAHVEVCEPRERRHSGEIGR
jgi:hypothetical protein